jgi:hypothetical protein
MLLRRLHKPLDQVDKVVSGRESPTNGSTPLKKQKISKTNDSSADDSPAVNKSVGNKSKKKSKGRSATPVSGSIDVAFLVPSSFDGDSFTPSSKLLLGNVFGCFEKDDSVSALYQVTTTDSASLVVGDDFPEIISLPVGERYFILSAVGFEAVGSFATPLKVNHAVVTTLRSQSILSALSPKSGSSKRSHHDAMSEPFPDEEGGDMWDSRKEKFRESAGFRTVCLNDERVWSGIAGPRCSVDSAVSLINVRATIPVKLRSLPVSDSKVLGAFAKLMFSEPPFKPFFPRPEKKVDTVHLGYFLFPTERFFSVEFVRLALSRLVTILGCVSSSPSAWESVFRPLSRLLCSAEEWNMTEWDVGYVFKFVHIQLGKLSAQSVSSHALTLHEDELVPYLASALEVDFSLEMSNFLVQRGRMDKKPSSYAAKPSPTTNSPLGSGTRVTTAPIGVCIKHAASQLKLSSQSCDASCGRTHLSLSTPLTTDQKSALKLTSNVMKESTFKRKFLAAIA